MGSLAGLLVGQGHQVSGSDTAFYPPIGPLLEHWGIQCRQGFLPENIPTAVDLVVIGNVCRPDNPEARAAIDRGLPYTHIAGALRRFALDGASPLVVTGTHGKTTTASLCAWLLEAAGAKPGFMIGGIPANFERGFRSSAPHAPFVVEGDEYDTAFFEKTAKFLHYGAQVAIITSVEHDHVDIYPTFDDYLDAFAKFVRGLPTNGLLVVNAEDAHAVQLAASAPCRVVYYGVEQALPGASSFAPMYLAAALRVEREGTAFELRLPDAEKHAAWVPLVGSHNIGNALAALVAAREGYHAPLGALLEGLREFRGVKRRQELLGTPAGVAVYDDFAHHPSAVSATLRALRNKHPASRLFAVFEPRSATACRNTHQADYVECFDAADEVILAPLGRSGLSAEERLDVDAVCAGIRERGGDAVAAPSVDAIVERLSGRATAGDVIAVLSNGAFGGIHARLLSALEGRAPQELSQRSS